MVTALECDSQRTQPRRQSAVAVLLDRVAARLEGQQDFEAAELARRVRLRSTKVELRFREIQSGREDREVGKG